MANLRLFLLGSMEIRHHDQQLPTLPTLKSQSLFAYLVLHRQQPQRRERLADIFSGGRPERRARRYLITTLQPGSVERQSALASFHHQLM